MALRATHVNEDASNSRDRLLTRAARIRAATVRERSLASSTEFFMAPAGATTRDENNPSVIFRGTVHSSFTPLIESLRG